MKNQGLKKEFVRIMQSKIFSGELKIGQKLTPERELAGQMGISRSLVNAGLLELESQGFITMVPRQGSIVADYKKNGTLQILVALMHYDSSRIDFALFQNMMDLRLLIECESTRIAAARITPDEVEKMELLLSCVRACRNFEDAVEPIVRFHHIVTQASGNTVYAMTFKSFEPVVVQLVRTHFAIVPDISHTVKLHDVLLNDLRAHDPVKSVQSMRACLMHGIGILKRQYRSGQE